MTVVDRLVRSYLVVEVPQPATSASVAALFDAGAAALRRHGDVTVHHVAFETGDLAATTTTSLTIYYDRVERRRTLRD